jgi:hypothetical protein
VFVFVGCGRARLDVAGADDLAAQVALAYYNGTDIGVMDAFGKVLKRSTR